MAKLKMYETHICTIYCMSGCCNILRFQHKSPDRKSFPSITGNFSLGIIRRSFEHIVLLNEIKIITVLG